MGLQLHLCAWTMFLKMCFLALLFLGTVWFQSFSLVPCLKDICLPTSKKIFNLRSKVWLQWRKLMQISEYFWLSLGIEKVAPAFPSPSTTLGLFKQQTKWCTKLLQYCRESQNTTCAGWLSHIQPQSPISFRGGRILTLLSLCVIQVMYHLDHSQNSHCYFPFSSGKFFQKLNSRNGTEFWCFSPLTWLME